LTAAHKKHQNAFMRTTVDLPDDLLRRVKSRAALEGLKLKDLIARFIEQGLRQGAAPEPSIQERHRSLLPVVQAATGRALPVLSNAELSALLDEDEIGVGRLD